MQNGNSTFSAIDCIQIGGNCRKFLGDPSRVSFHDGKTWILYAFR